MLQKIVTALVLVAAAFPAFADEMTFFMTNRLARAAVVELNARDRDFSWPGGEEVYLLEKGERKSVPIPCEAGETICYAAWARGDDRISFGVGPDNDQACDDCCSICVAKTTATIVIGPKAP